MYTFGEMLLQGVQLGQQARRDREALALQRDQLAENRRQADLADEDRDAQISLQRTSQRDLRQFRADTVGLQEDQFEETKRANLEAETFQRRELDLPGGLAEFAGRDRVLAADAGFFGQLYEGAQNRESSDRNAAAGRSVQYAQIASNERHQAAMQRNVADRLALDRTNANLANALGLMDRGVDMATIAEQTGLDFSGGRVGQDDPFFNVNQAVGTIGSVYESYQNQPGVLSRVISGTIQTGRHQKAILALNAARRSGNAAEVREAEAELERVRPNDPDADRPLTRDDVRRAVETQFQGLVDQMGQLRGMDRVSRTRVQGGESGALLYLAPEMVLQQLPEDVLELVGEEWLDDVVSKVIVERDMTFSGSALEARQFGREQALRQQYRGTND